MGLKPIGGRWGTTGTIRERMIDLVKSKIMKIIKDEVDTANHIRKSVTPHEAYHMRDPVMNVAIVPYTDDGERPMTL